MSEKAVIVPFEEVVKLRKLKAGPLFERAEEIQRTIKELEAELAEIKPKIQMKLELAEVKSVRFIDFDFIAREGYQRKTLDSTWAKQTLVKKGISTDEIEKHMKVAEIAPSVTIKSVKQAGGTGGEE